MTADRSTKKQPPLFLLVTSFFLLPVLPGLKEPQTVGPALSVSAIFAFLQAMTLALTLILSFFN